MKFSIKVQYGIQAMLELGLKHGGGSIQSADIARSQKIPVRYLEHLLLDLKNGGLINSTRGIHGGYTLAKIPGHISLLEIIETLEGEFELAGRKTKQPPVLLETFQKIQEDFKGILAKIRLEELIIKKRQKEGTHTYSI